MPPQSRQPRPLDENTLWVIIDLVQRLGGDVTVSMTGAALRDFPYELIATQSRLDNTLRLQVRRRQVTVPGEVVECRPELPAP